MAAFLGPPMMLVRLLKNFPCMKASVDEKLLKTIKFPALFKQKVDLKKVNIESIKPWIVRTVTALLNGYEDDILIELVFNLIQEWDDPKKITVQLLPFFGEEKIAVGFMQDLWSLLLDANTQTSGIPTSIIEERKQQFLKQGGHEYDFLSKGMNVNDIASSISQELKCLREQGGSGRSRVVQSNAATTARQVPSASRSRSPSSRSRPSRSPYRRSRSPTRRDNRQASTRRYHYSRSPVQRHPYRRLSPSLRSSSRNRGRSGSRTRAAYRDHEPSASPSRPRYHAPSKTMSRSRSRSNSRDSASSLSNWSPSSSPDYSP